MRRRHRRRIGCLDTSGASVENLVGTGTKACTTFDLCMASLRHDEDGIRFAAVVRHHAKVGLLVFPVVATFGNGANLGCMPVRAVALVAAAASMIHVPEALYLKLDGIIAAAAAGPAPRKPFRAKSNAWRSEACYHSGHGFAAGHGSAAVKPARHRSAAAKPARRFSSKHDDAG